jgi:hypothetical protein
MDGEVVRLCNWTCPGVARLFLLRLGRRFSIHLELLVHLDYLVPVFISKRCYNETIDIVLASIPRCPDTYHFFLVPLCLLLSLLQEEYKFVHQPFNISLVQPRLPNTDDTQSDDAKNQHPKDDLQMA